MALKYFEFIKRQPRKYLETSNYVVCGEKSAESHLQFLNQHTEDQRIFWSSRKPLVAGRLCLRVKMHLHISVLLVAGTGVERASTVWLKSPIGVGLQDGFSLSAAH